MLAQAFAILKRYANPDIECPQVSNDESITHVRGTYVYSFAKALEKLKIEFHMNFFNWDQRFITRFILSLYEKVKLVSIR